MNTRQYIRFDEEIAKNEQVVNIKANINVIISSIYDLVTIANNVAISNIDWNVNVSFDLLRNIFEDIVTGLSNHYTKLL
jgi:hypothetical protein